MTPLRPKLKKKFTKPENLKIWYAQKITPKSQAKIEPPFPQYSFLTIFNPKKYHANKYTVLSLNRIYETI